MRLGGWCFASAVALVACHGPTVGVTPEDSTVDAVDAPSGPFDARSDTAPPPFDGAFDAGFDATTDASIDGDAAAGPLCVSHGDGTCASVGVTNCGPFQADPVNGTCFEQVNSCGGANVATPSSKNCAPITACVGAPGFPDPLPDVPDDVVIFVKGGADDASATGDRDHPWPTIGEALKQAESVPLDTPVVIALWDGDYEENLAIDRPVSIYGRCLAPSAAARIVAFDPASPAVLATAPFELHSIEARGGGISIALDAGGKALLDHVYVHSTPGAAIDASGTGSVEITGSVVEDAQTAGVSLTCAGTIDASVVRQIHATAGDDKSGVGVRFSNGVGSGLQITDSVIESIARVGISGTGSVETHVAIDTSIVRNVDAIDTGSISGTGIDITTPVVLRLDQSLIEQTKLLGLHLTAAADVVVSQTVFRHNDLAAPARLSSTDFAGAIGAVGAITVQSSSIEDATFAGVEVRGSLTMDATIVRRVTAADVSSPVGGGVVVEHDASGDPASTITDCIVQSVPYVGVASYGAEVSVEGSRIEGTSVYPGSTIGGGISAWFDVDAGVAGSIGTIDTRVVDGGVAAAFAAGGKIDARTSAFSCNDDGDVVHLATVGGVAGTFISEGSSCGCGAAAACTTKIVTLP